MFPSIQLRYGTWQGNSYAACCTRHSHGLKLALGASSISPSAPLSRRLMLDRMDLLDSKPSVIWCDSQARAEAIDNGDITIRYVHTSENRADLFTKALSSPVIRSHLDAIRQGAPFPGL